MAGQTEVKISMDVAVAGMLSTASDGLCEADGKHNENASDDDYPNIELGVMVGVGTEVDGVLSLAAQADKLAGISMRSQARDPGMNVDLDSGAVLPDQTLGVLRRGRIWVQIEETVTAGSAVRYRAVATTTETPGIFRSSDPTGTDTVLISEGARWVTGGTASGSPSLGIAELEIDMLNLTLASDS